MHRLPPEHRLMTVRACAALLDEIDATAAEGSLVRRRRRVTRSDVVRAALRRGLPLARQDLGLPLNRGINATRAPVAS